jgi:hypothetical protein
MCKEEEFLNVLAWKEYSIWRAKQEILRHEAEIKRIQLELSPQSQSFSHSEKDKLASVSYNHNFISFDNYRASVTKAKDTAPAPVGRSIRANRFTKAQENHSTNPFRASFQGKYQDYDRAYTLGNAYFDFVRKSIGTFQ